MAPVLEVADIFRRVGGVAVAAFEMAAAEMASFSVPSATISASLRILLRLILLALWRAFAAAPAIKWAA